MKVQAGVWGEGPSILSLRLEASGEVHKRIPSPRTSGNYRHSQKVRFRWNALLNFLGDLGI